MDTRFRKILIIHGHWYNRGDEAAIRAMLEEIRIRIPNSSISLQILAREYCGIEVFQELNVKLIDNYFPRKRDVLEWFSLFCTRGKVVWSEAGKHFINEIKNADIVLYAPGGPSIGDVYQKNEWGYFRRLLLINRMGIPYFFYAPSAGPFKMKLRNVIRKYIYTNAAGIVFREDISAKYFQELLPNKEFKVTLDAAFQNDIDIALNKGILHDYVELRDFFNKYNRIIGITITDLKWNPKYINNDEIKNRIENSFNRFIDYLVSKDYGVIFIPQLFGQQNDYDYMKKFCGNGTFIIEDKYDCYFQQYIISKLYAVVGMRYHSNIFSCKMGTPFISISYEQKMKGFMEKVNLEDYCINVDDICEELLINRFHALINNHAQYSELLKEIGPQLQKKSKETTDYLLEIIEKTCSNTRG